MNSTLGRFFHIRKGESRLVSTLGGVLFINALCSGLAGIVAVSGFLTTGGVNQILLVYLVDYVLILLSSALQSLIIDRFGRDKLVGGMLLLFALLFVVLRVLFAVGAPGWLNYSLMFVVAEQQFVFFPLIFWVLANDTVTMEQSTRLFPLISSGGLVGQLAGILLAMLLPWLLLRLNLSPEAVLVWIVVLYLLALLMLVWGLRGVRLRRTVQQTESLRSTLAEGWQFIREVDSFRYLTYGVLAMAFCSIVIEFRFFVVSDGSFPTQFDYQRFYSIYRLVLAVLAFVVQALLTSRVLRSLGLKRTMFILPVVTLLGAVVALLSPGLWVMVFATGIFMLIRQTTYDSAVKSMQALIPEERRGRVSALLDGYVPAFGIVLGCLLTWLIVWVGLLLGVELHRVYLALAVLASALSLWWMYRMYRTYDTSLLNWRLKRRQRTRSEVLDKLEF